MNELSNETKELLIKQAKAKITRLDGERQDISHEIELTERALKELKELK